jgi:hypothetical protein
VQPLNQFLVLYQWFPLAALLMFVALIARFYEKFSGKRTFFRFYLVALVLFGGAAVRYAGAGKLAGDPLGDVLLGLGGIVLLLLGGHLYRMMLAQPLPDQE